MIRADLIVEGASEVVTCASPAPWTVSGSARHGRISSITNGILACAGERIVFAGTPEQARAAELTLDPAGRRLSAAGCVVLPGFIDAHTHLPFGGWRDAEFEMRLAGRTYQEIAAAGGGILSTVRSTRALPAEALAALVRDRLDAMLLTGTTTVEAKSGYGLSVESEIAILRALRLAASHPVEVIPTFLGAHVVGPEYRDGRREEYVKLLVGTLIPRVASEGLARFCDVFIDEGAFTLDEARRILDAAKTHDLGLRVHAEQLTRTGGAVLAASLGAWSVDHLERLAEDDIAQLAATWTRNQGGGGTVALLLPGAAHTLREKTHPPARALINAGVPVALATDFNPGTSPCHSMPAILNLACLLFGLTPDEAILAATRNAALSLGIEDRAGTLESGKQADFVLWKVPSRAHLAYRFGALPCFAVVKRGRIRVEHGQLTGSVAAVSIGGNSMLIEQTVHGFLDSLSSDAPTPGGGSASALAGAQAAALIQMVIALTIKNEKYAAARPVLEPMARKLEGYRTDLELLVDRDSQAYDAVVAANRLPKETDEQKAARKDAREKAFLYAAEIPLKTVELSCAVAQLAAEAAPHINPNAASDVLVAGLLADAAVGGGAANVRINLGSIKSENFTAKATERLAEWTARSAGCAAALKARFGEA